MDKFSGAGFSQSGTVGKLFGYASPALDPRPGGTFAILDFETSGTTPEKGRVIEVAVVTMSFEGVLIEEYSTLLNPEDGNVGLSMIHHIVPRMVENAPTFREIAEDLASRLIGNVVVSHNAVFEEKFLSAELNKAGLRVPLLPALDTLQFLPRVLQLEDYKQTTIMQHLGIETDAHTALGDARGLAKILALYLSEAANLGYPIEFPEKKPVTSRSRVSQRVTNLRKGDQGWMANLLPKLPVSSFALADFDRYMYWQLLLDVLEDGKITGEEIRQLANLIGRSGLSQADVRELNRQFFDQQLKVAEEDGHVSKEESQFLAKVRAALYILD